MGTRTISRPHHLNHAQKPPNSDNQSRRFQSKVLIIILCRQDMFRYVTLWSFNIAMENGPFTDYFPIKASIYKGFSIAMLNNQRVSVSWPFPWWTCNRSHGAAFGLGFLPHFAHGVLQPGHGVSPLRVSPKRKNNNLIGIRKWLMYVHVIW